jgi:hypothetical protein
LRSIPFFFFTAALIAVSGPSKAAPRNIGECEKIQAADAYNLCLASFGPVARGHHAYADGAGVGKQDAAQDAVSEESSQKDAAVEHARRHHRHAFKHANRHQHWAKHGGTFHKRAVSQRSKHGGKMRMALSISPGRSRLR